MDRSSWLDVAGKIALGIGGAALATAGVLAAKSGVFLGRSRVAELKGDVRAGNVAA